MYAYDFAYVGFSGGISTRASPASPGNLWHLSAEESQAEGPTEVGQWEACDKVLTDSYQVKIFCQFCQFLSNCVKAWVIQSSTPFQKRASSTNPPALESHLQQLTHRKCTAAPCGTASPLHRFTEHLRFLRFLQSSVLFLRQFRCF
jgi:hypothetical protein